MANANTSRPADDGDHTWYGSDRFSGGLRDPVGVRMEQAERGMKPSEGIFSNAPDGVNTVRRQATPGGVMRATRPPMPSAFDERSVLRMFFG